MSEIEKAGIQRDAQRRAVSSPGASQAIIRHLGVDLYQERHPASRTPDEPVQAKPMTVLVTYATKMGATASIAAAIGHELRAAGFTVDVHEIGAVPAVTPYDVVVLGSAIYQGRWLPEAVRFLRRHGRLLRTRSVWLFHSGPLGASRRHDQPVPADVERIARELSTPPVKTFAGNLQADVVLHDTDLERLVGDSRDWKDVRIWSQQIASAPEPSRGGGVHCAHH
ncbi:flavodoxin domain-containing protein [Kribbella sp. NPDC048928]|uniref:flavodoxin domain-containing protein n=1 Tax=Kribbella sp. NPDC048928 TaxID=3364111 RepID=UPI0037219A43